MKNLTKLFSYNSTFLLQDDNDNIVCFKDDTLTFTLILMKIQVQTQMPKFTPKIVNLVVVFFKTSDESLKIMVLC